MNLALSIINGFDVLSRTPLKEVLVADAAADEQLALRMMRQDATMFPETKMVVRDPTHAVQRVLQRPFAAVPEIHLVHSVLITRSDSFTRTIQCSDVLGAAFARFYKKIEGNTRIRNLQMRKHRFNSSQRPTGRMVLFLRPFVATAIFTTTHRSGERDGNRAEQFLEFLSEPRLLLLAMLADASDEVDILLRFLDEGAYDMATLVSEIQQFVGRISGLFLDGHCRSSGYTEHMLGTLETPITFLRKDHGPHRVGGRERMTDAVFQQALKDNLVSFSHKLIR